MVELFADARLALKAIEEDRVGFHVGMWNLERHDAVVARVGGAVDGRHAAARHWRFNAVGVDLRTGFKAVVKAHWALLRQETHHFTGKRARGKDSVRNG